MSRKKLVLRDPYARFFLKMGMGVTENTKLLFGLGSSCHRSRR